LLVVISGPSGCGKSTIVKHLGARMDFERSVSCTTRNKRENEKEGEDYHFISREEFEKKIKEGYFLEYARVFGNYYGTPAGPLVRALEEGKIFILEIDVQGAEQALKRYPDALTIFIEPPGDEKILVERLKKRSTEDEEEIRKRLAVAGEELAQRDKYRYSVANDILEKAVEEVKRIIETNYGGVYEEDRRGGERN